MMAMYLSQDLGKPAQLELLPLLVRPLLEDHEPRLVGKRRQITSSKPFRPAELLSSMPPHQRSLFPTLRLMRSYCHHTARLK